MLLILVIPSNDSAHDQIVKSTGFRCAQVGAELQPDALIGEKPPDFRVFKPKADAPPVNGQIMNRARLLQSGKHIQIFKLPQQHIDPAIPLLTDLQAFVGLVLLNRVAAHILEPDTDVGPFLQKPQKHLADSADTGLLSRIAQIWIIMVGAFQTRAVSQQQIADVKLRQYQRLPPFPFTGNPDQLLTVHILIQLRNTAQSAEMPYQSQQQIWAA